MNGLKTYGFYELENSFLQIIVLRKERKKGNVLSFFVRFKKIHLYYILCWVTF